MYLTEKQFNVVLKKQAEMVRAPSFFEPYFKGKKMPEKWFMKYDWTEKEETKFKKWLVTYLMKTLHVSKKVAENKAAWHILNYGWTYKK